MAAWAAEPVVEIEMAKGGVEVVVRHQDDDPAAKPDAFGVASGTVDGLAGLDEFVGFALNILGGIGGISCRRLARLVLSAALGKSASDTDQKCERGDGEVAQNRKLKLKQPSTHKFPELLPACGQLEALA